MNREEKLHLLQLAYKRWINEYPGETIDQSDCHLPQIQANLGLPSSITGFEGLSGTTDK